MKITEWCIRTPLLVLLFLGCNQEDDVLPKKELLLSKVYKNGELSTEYVYGLDKKLLTINYYKRVLGVHVKSDFIHLSYNVGALLTESVAFSKNNIGKTKFTYTYNVSGQLVQRDFFIIYENGTTTRWFYTEYAYNQKQELIRETYYYEEDVSDSWYADYTYDNHGNLLSSTRFTYDDEASDYLKTGTTTCEQGDMPLPEHWNNYLVPLIEFEFFEFTLVRSTVINYYSSDKKYTGITNVTGRVYNDAGYVTAQTITLIETDPDNKETSEVENMTYEYVE